MDPDRGAGHRPSGPRPCPSAATTRALALVLAAGVALASTACVGNTGRNDDQVAPGSGKGPSGNVVPHDGG
jgi:hypothetical protein